MTSTKRLRSVAQSTAHHAVSGLCHLHPHLGAQCKLQGILASSLDLMSGIVEPAVQETKELTLSTKALCARFAEILETEGLVPTELQSASASFTFTSRWPDNCIVRVHARSGAHVEVEVRDNMTTEFRGAQLAVQRDGPASGGPGV